MNEERQIAQAILDAQKTHEDCYVRIDELTGGYKYTIEDCLIEACKINNLSENLWALLGLIIHWWDDAQLWAEDILAGRKVGDVTMEDLEKNP